MDTKVKPNIENLRINGQRLWDSLMELAQIGATPKGGVCRLALTPEGERFAREAVRLLGQIEELRDSLHGDARQLGGTLPPAPRLPLASARKTCSRVV